MVLSNFLRGDTGQCHSVAQNFITEIATLPFVVITIHYYNCLYYDCLLFSIKVTLSIPIEVANSKFIEVVYHCIEFLLFVGLVEYSCAYSTKASCILNYSFKAN